MVSLSPQAPMESVQCRPPSAIQALSISWEVGAVLAAGGTTSSFSLLLIRVSSFGKLALNHLRHFKKFPVRIGRVGQRRLARKRGPLRIRTHSVEKAFAAGFAGVNAEAVGSLRHGRNIGGIELVEQINVSQDRVEILDHALPFGGCQLQIGKIGDRGDVFFGDFHNRWCPLLPLRVYIDDISARISAPKFTNTIAYTVRP